MVIYNPTAEYRLIDMNSCMDLNRVDIIVYWKGKFGHIHPFELNPGNAASVKIMFRRKDFNTKAQVCLDTVLYTMSETCEKNPVKDDRL